MKLNAVYLYRAMKTWSFAAPLLTEYGAGETSISSSSTSLAVSTWNTHVEYWTHRIVKSIAWKTFNGMEKHFPDVLFLYFQSNYGMILITKMFAWTDCMMPSYSKTMSKTQKHLTKSQKNNNNYACIVLIYLTLCSTCRMSIFQW